MSVEGQPEGQCEYAGFSLIVEKYQARDAAHVVVPEGVTQILSDAFRDHEEIESIQLPSTLQSIGAGAFHGCANLREIVIPESVFEVGNRAFLGCRALRSAQLPEGLMKLDRFVFGLCESLEEVRGGTEMVTVESRAFSGCASLRELPDFPRCEAIGSEAFAGCSALRAVILPDTVRSVGNEAFRGCAGIEVVRIPKTVESLGKNLLVGCANLREVDGADDLVEAFPDAFPRDIAHVYGFLRPQDHSHDVRAFRKAHAKEIDVLRAEIDEEKASLRSLTNRIEGLGLRERTLRKQLEEEAAARIKHLRAQEKKLSALQNPSDAALLAFISKDAVS